MENYYTSQYQSAVYTVIVPGLTQNRRELFIKASMDVKLDHKED